MKNEMIEQHPTGRAVAKRDAEKAKFIEALKKTPIVQLASQQSGIPRSTYYRWRKEDAAFANACDEAIADGVRLVNDLAETKLIAAIKEGDFPAIRFWLKNRNPNYAEKLHVQAKLETLNQPLTSEQESVIRRALELARLTNNHDDQSPSLLSSGSGKGPADYP